MTNLDRILKSRDITLPTKVHTVKDVVFPGVMYGCESWTIRWAEHWRIDAFELWCWRRLSRVPWTARSKSILNEINPEYSLEGLVLKLKLQYIGHLMRRADSLEKTLILVKTECTRRRLEGVNVYWHQLNGHEFEQSPKDGEGRESWYAAVHGVIKSQGETEQQQNIHWGGTRKMPYCSTIVPWLLFISAFSP